MTDVQYSITLYDYWSATSGLAGGALADSLCIKDKNKLPFLPGKTVKGLMREAIEMLAGLHTDMFSAQFVNEVFGELERESGKANSGNRTEEAKAHFSNAVMDDATAVQVLKEKLADALFEQISSTAIMDNGMARKGSLRRAEYAVPCTLYGTIHEVAPAHVEALKICAAFVKRLGYNRHRGYGRCKIQLLHA